MTLADTPSECSAAGREPLRLEHLQLHRREDGVAVLTLDLPDRRNMMDAAMTRSWVRAVHHLHQDAGLRAVVVTGAGSAFCSGGDTAWIGGDPGAGIEALRERMHAFYGDWLSLRRLDVPTVAAVNGAAVGAGLALALACDLRVVSSTARLGVPFTALGLHPGMATTWSLPEVAGLQVARDLLLTGRMVDGDEAVRLGLALRAVPVEQVLPEALHLAATIASRAPVATRLTTRALRAGGHHDHATALAWEALAQAVTLATDDLQEGLAAQREKRTPRFTGR